MDYSSFRRSPNIDDRRPTFEGQPVSVDELATMLRYPLKKDWPSPMSIDGRKFPQIAADFPMDPNAPQTPVDLRIFEAATPDQRQMLIKALMGDANRP